MGSSDGFKRFIDPINYTSEAIRFNFKNWKIGFFGKKMIFRAKSLLEAKKVDFRGEVSDKNERPRKRRRMS